MKPLIALVQILTTLMWHSLNPNVWYHIIIEHHLFAEIVVGIGMLLVGLILDLVLILSVMRWFLVA